MDVVAAGEEEAVKAFHHVRDGRLNAEDRHGNAACLRHSLAVVLVQDVQVPRRLFFEVHGYADKRFHNRTFSFRSFRLLIHLSRSKEYSIFPARKTDF
jgi:hypothetical protein